MEISILIYFTFEMMRNKIMKNHLINHLIFAFASEILIIYSFF